MRGKLVGHYEFILFIFILLIKTFPTNSTILWPYLQAYLRRIPGIMNIVRLYKEMPIPADILAVERPKNTVVIAYGKDKSLYAVRQRVGCKNVGGRHLPVNGLTIGHIIDGAYVPVAEKIPKRHPGRPKKSI